MTMLTSLLRSAEAAQPDLENISIANAGIVAGLGYAMVFVGLISLLVVVFVIGKIFTAKSGEKKAVKETKKEEAPAAVSVAPVAAPAASDLAPGTAGSLKTYDVPPKTCAMLMAIVANKMGKPLNELRFISIKEGK